LSTSISVYLIAGEPSGDVLGGRLIKGLKALAGDDISISGVGGPNMMAQGLRSIFPMHELSVMGIVEVLPKIPTLLARIKQTAADIIEKKPDVVVTIDAPDFCFRVAKRLAGYDIPIVHYVAPSVWAWRPGRAKKVAALVDHVMCLLPFEPPYFTREGVDATFVGHSILESGADAGDGQAFRTQHNIAEDAPLLCVLPGSRHGEVSRLMGVFGETLRNVSTEVDGLHIVIPTIASVADHVRAESSDWPNTLVVEGDAEKYNAFAAANASLAASGTVSLELALAGVPSIIAYRMAPISAYIARKFVKLEYVSIINLILKREAMPELLLEDCTVEKLTPAVIALLGSEDAQSVQKAAFKDALTQLRAADSKPSDAAAQVVYNVALKSKN
jgi:lipid-A-disaccharide synthase